MTLKWLKLLQGDYKFSIFSSMRMFKFKPIYYNFVVVYARIVNLHMYYSSQGGNSQ